MLTLLTMPVLAKEPMLSELPLRFSVAPETSETADVAGIELLALTVIVPALMFVAPV